MKFSSPDQVVSSTEKVKLLGFLRRTHGKTEKEASDNAPRQVTLKRRTVSELTVNQGAARGKTVNVEVRQKRTYVKRSTMADGSEVVGCGARRRLRKLQNRNSSVSPRSARQEPGTPPPGRRRQAAGSRRGQTPGRGSAPARRSRGQAGRRCTGATRGKAKGRKARCARSPRQPRPRPAEKPRPWPCRTSSRGSAASSCQGQARLASRCRRKATKSTAPHVTSAPSCTFPTLADARRGAIKKRPRKQIEPARTPSGGRTDFLKPARAGRARRRGR